MKTLVAAFLLALVLGGGVAKVMQTINPVCSWITPDDWFLYWLYGCNKESAGGGGSGAGN